VLGQGDLFAAELGEGQVSDAKIHEWKPMGG
jgi:hypothetical protein